jgi:hypothetical protein
LPNKAVDRSAPVSGCQKGGEPLDQNWLRVASTDRLAVLDLLSQ